MRNSAFMPGIYARAWLVAWACAGFAPAYSLAEESGTRLKYSTANAYEQRREKVKRHDSGTDTATAARVERVTSTELAPPQAVEAQAEAEPVEPAPTPAAAKPAATKTAPLRGERKVLKLHVPDPDSVHQVMPPSAQAPLRVLDQQLSADDDLPGGAVLLPVAQKANREIADDARNAAIASVKAKRADGAMITGPLASDAEHAEMRGQMGASVSTGVYSPGIGRRLLNQLATPLAASLGAVDSMVGGAQHVLVTLSEQWAEGSREPLPYAYAPSEPDAVVEQVVEAPQEPAAVSLAPMAQAEIPAPPLPPAAYSTQPQPPLPPQAYSPSAGYAPPAYISAPQQPYVPPAPYPPQAYLPQAYPPVMPQAPMPYYAQPMPPQAAPPAYAPDPAASVFGADNQPFMIYYPPPQYYVSATQQQAAAAYAPQPPAYAPAPVYAPPVQAPAPMPPQVSLQPAAPVQPTPAAPQAQAMAQPAPPASDIPMPPGYQLLPPASETPAPEAARIAAAPAQAKDRVTVASSPAPVIVVQRSSANMARSSNTSPQTTVMTDFAQLSPASGPQALAPATPVVTPVAANDGLPPGAVVVEPASEPVANAPATTPPATPVFEASVTLPGKGASQATVTQNAPAPGTEATPTIAAPTPVAEVPAGLPTPVLGETAASEPAPALDSTTRKTLAKIPSQIDTPKKTPTERLSVEHGKNIEKKETAAATPATPGTPATPPAPGTPEAAAKEKASPINIKVDVRKPAYDSQYELERAYNALTAGNTEQAIALYNNVVIAEPNNKQALFGLAATYHRLGQLEKARPLYSRLLKLEPTHREALNNFLALAADEAPEEALQELQSLESRNPNFSPIPAQIAFIHQKMGNNDLAIEKMMRAVSLSDDNLTYRYNLAVMLDKAGKGSEAADMYQHVLDAAYRGQPAPGDVQRIQQRLTYLRSNKP